MNNLFFLVSLLSLLLMIVGIIKPSIVIRWGTKKTRKRVLKVYGIIFIAAFIAFSVTVPTDPDQISQENRGLESVEQQEKSELESEVEDEVKVSDEDEITKDKLEKLPIEALEKDIDKIKLSELKVHYLNVGQADSILIQNGNASMLIDAGNNDDADVVVNYLKQQGIKKLEYIIGTHPHEDHIGGLDVVVNTFDIGKIYMPKITHTTKTFKDVVASIKNKGLKITTPVPASTFDLCDAKCTIVAPNSSSYEDINNYSIVLKVQYGDTSYLFTGDAEDVSEGEMLQKGFDISSNVLKVGHHGSHSSSTDAFLNKVNPKYAVICVGKDNDYGHPHQETMDKLKSRGIKVYRTDQCGTLISTSDGKNITFSTNPGDYSYNNAQQPMSSSSPSQSKEKIYIDANGQGLIKGNINSKGEKIYHMPGGSYYDKTNPEAWFKTEIEAQAAGFRRSKR